MSSNESNVVYILEDQGDGFVAVKQGNVQQPGFVEPPSSTQKPSNHAGSGATVELLNLLNGVSAKDHIESAHEEFPADFLPESIRLVVDAVQQKIQCPYELAVQGVLGAISTSYATQWDVEGLDEMVMPITLAQLSCAISGDRKSSTDNEVHKGIQQGVQKYNESKDNEHKAVIFTSNTTVEGMAEQFKVSPVIVIRTADASIFLNSHSMGKEHSDETIACLADAWSGYPINQIRVKGNRFINQPRLGFNLMTQEDYFLTFITNPRYEQQGITARTLYLITRTLQGTRLIDEAAYLNGERKARSQVIKDFHDRTEAAVLAGLENFHNNGERRVLRPDSDAESVLVELYNQYESELVHDDLRGDPWAQRRLEHVTRLAALFDLYQGNQHLTRDSLCDAAKLVDFYLKTYLRIKGFGKKTKTEREADRLFDWLISHPNTRDSRKIQQNAKKGTSFGKASDIKRLLTELDDAGKVILTSHLNDSTWTFDLIETAV